MVPLYAACENLSKSAFKRNCSPKKRSSCPFQTENDHGLEENHLQKKISRLRSTGFVNTVRGGASQRVY